MHPKLNEMAMDKLVYTTYYSFHVYAVVVQVLL